MNYTENYLSSIYQQKQSIKSRSMRLQNRRNSIQQVNAAIKRWNLNSKIADFEHINTFRYKLKRLSPIPFQLIEKCIKIIILEKFNWAFKQDIASQKHRLDFEIKQKYQQLYFSEGCNQDFKFYFLMVLIVKTCCYFVQNNITDIQIDEAFQSEIFIILMHIIIGVKIGTKSFKGIFQKYRFKHKKAKRNDNKDANTGSLFKLQKLQVNKQPKQYISKHKVSSVSSKKSLLMTNYSKRRAGLSNNPKDARFSLLSKISIHEDQYTQFAKQVKNYLYVKPLPPAIKKKLTVRQLDHQNEEMHPYNYEKILPNIQRKMRANAVISNQLSHSFQYFITQNGQQSPRLSNSFKINCKPQQSSLNYKFAPFLPKVKTIKQSQPVSLSRKQRKRMENSSRLTKRKDVSRWKEVLNGLKSSRYESQNFKSKTNIRDLTNLDAQKQNMCNITQLEVNSSEIVSSKIDIFEDSAKFNSQYYEKRIVNEKIKQKSIFDLNRIDKKMGTISPPQFIKKKSTKNKGELIKSYKNFVEKCNQRSQQIFDRPKQL